MVFPMFPLQGIFKRHPEPLNRISYSKRLERVYSQFITSSGRSSDSSQEIVISKISGHVKCLQTLFTSSTLGSELIIELLPHLEDLGERIENFSYVSTETLVTTETVLRNRVQELFSLRIQSLLDTAYRLAQTHKGSL